jgi:hypothetical protein
MITKKEDSILSPISAEIQKPKPAEKLFDRVLNKVEAAIRTQTREDMIELRHALIQREYDLKRMEIILGTEAEQNLFLERINELITNPGQYDIQYMSERLAGVVDEEFAKGRTRLERLRYSLGLDTLSRDADPNYGMVDQNTTLIPIELHLAFLEGDSAQSAYSRLRGQYANRGFDAIFIIDKDHILQGMIKLDSLKDALDKDPLAKLGDI